MRNINPILLADFYKQSHAEQYPAGTEYIYSNWTPRTSRIEGQDKVVFFGLQYFLEEYLGNKLFDSFFELPRVVVKSLYNETIGPAIGPNEAMLNRILDLHHLGYIPLKFSALPEGTLCPLRVPMLTVENTHPDFFWLVNYYETIMSAVMWMPCTSATNAYRLRRLLDQGCKETGGSPEFVPFQGHDFSMRGMAGLEAACLSGAGHLLSFVGTDTIPALDFIKEYYGHNHETDGLLGCSVPATEHSVMSAGGEMSELETFERLLSIYQKGIVSVVSDTWDIWHVLTSILPSLKEKILNRDGTLVVRPDSGDPVKIICGNPDARDERERRGVVGLLWDCFGGTINEAGFKQLNPKVGCIYGDSINYERMSAIINGLKANGFASTNMVFGVGSYTYQYVTRDTYGFAMKATWARINGEGRDLFKKPVTDNGMKFSATGRLAVVRNDDGELEVIERATTEQEAESLLEPVWVDGLFLRTQTFKEIRNVLQSQESVLV
jgi:nicotinamide phosphoribosyltransferase